MGTAGIFGTVVRSGRYGPFFNDVDFELEFQGADMIQTLRVLLEKGEGENGGAGKHQPVLGEGHFEDLGIIWVCCGVEEEFGGEFGGTVAFVGSGVPVHEMGLRVAGFAVGDVQACFPSGLIDRHEVRVGEYFEAEFGGELAEEIHSEGGGSFLSRHRGI